MSPLVIRTAAPFGYAVFLLALLGIGAAGVALLITAVRSGRRWRGAAGVLLLFGAAYTFWVNYSAEEDLDLNPHITAPAQLVGRWVDGAATLVLHADGSYQCEGRAACVAIGAAGTWEHAGDFDLVFRQADGGGAHAPVRYRVVSYRGRLRLTHPIDEDPDMWDGKLLFEHVTPGA
jgi:hypothetical protein